MLNARLFATLASLGLVVSLSSPVQAQDRPAPHRTAAAKRSLTKKQQDARDDAQFDDERGHGVPEDALFGDDETGSRAPKGRPPTAEWDGTLEEPEDAPAFDELETDASAGRAQAEHHGSTRPRRTRRPRRPYAAPNPDAIVWGPTSPPSSPDVLDYEDGAAVPPGYIKATRARRGLIIGGAVTFGVTYLLAAAYGAFLLEPNGYEDGYGATPSRDGAEALFVPVAGPFIALGTMETERGEAAALVVGGVAQASGFALLAAGIFSKSTVLVKTDGGVAITPTVTPRGVGIAGAF